MKSAIRVIGNSNCVRVEDEYQVAVENQLSMDILIVSKERIIKTLSIVNKYCYETDLLHRWSHYILFT